MSKQYVSMFANDSTLPKHSVALVEDDVALRESMAMVLIADRSVRWDIREFSSAEQAWKVLSIADAKHPDIMLMDIQFRSGISGVQCLQKLQAIGIDIPTLVISGVARYDVVFDALVAGAQGYLHKPIQIENFLPAIHEVIQGKSPMSSDIARMVIQHFQQFSPTMIKKGIVALSKRESEILSMMAKDMSAYDLAKQLNIAETTVKKHIQNIYKKLHVNSRQEALAKLIEQNNQHYSMVR